MALHIKEPMNYNTGWMNYIQRVVDIQIVGFMLRGHSASECRCKYYVILFSNDVVETGF